MHMPSALFSLLSDHPSISLTYINNKRGSYTLNKAPPMDKTLLTSPNLHHLSYTVLASYTAAECASEIAKFKTCLLSARNLKILRLQVAKNERSSDNSSDFQKGPLNMPFQLGDQFPTLEELTLDRCLQNYFPTAKHCRMWTLCMDWSHLIKLDLGCGSPAYLLEALTGHVPQMKVLAFGFWGKTGAASELWNAANDLPVVVKFLESIDALETVVMTSNDDEELRQIRPALLRKHGASLRYLTADISIRDNGWEAQDFIDVASMAPGLRSLTATLELQEGETTGEGTIWPDRPFVSQTASSPSNSSTSVHTALTSLYRLQHLTL